jgi:hypothetical protein
LFKEIPVSLIPKERVRPIRRDDKIVEIFIAVSDDGLGEEIYSVSSSGGETLPVVALDHAALHLLRRYSQGIANRSGKNVRIIGFTRGTVHDTIRPVATGD